MGLDLSGELGEWHFPYKTDDMNVATCTWLDSIELSQITNANSPNDPIAPTLLSYSVSCESYCTMSTVL